MPLVFISRRLKEEEQNEAREILEKYSDDIEYTDIVNDSNIDLSIRTKSDILTSQKYKTLTVTFICLVQMDSKGINPFLFQPRNIGLRNLFLLGLKVSLFEINFVKPISSLIISMGGVINESADLNDANIVLTDQKFKTKDFSIPLVSSDWIYAISNQTLEVPYDKFLITKKPITRKKGFASASQVEEIQKIDVRCSERSSSQNVQFVDPTMKIPERSEEKKENISESKLNLGNQQQKAKSRKRNIFNCIRPLHSSSNNSDLLSSSENTQDFLPRPSFESLKNENDINKAPIPENKITKASNFQEKNDDEFDCNLDFTINKEANEKKKDICTDFPVPDTPERLRQNSPKIKTSPRSGHTISPKLKEINTILTKKSCKHKKSNNSIRSLPSIEELNDFSQIPKDENEDEDEFTNDVYYDNTKETQTQSEQHSTQLDEDVLFQMLDA